MYGVKINERDVGWTPLDIPGVSMKELHKDETTGAMAVLTRMDAGATIPAHFHTKADETVYVVTGDFVEDGASHGPGSYFVGKAGVNRGSEHLAASLARSSRLNSRTCKILVGKIGSV